MLMVEWKCASFPRTSYHCSLLRICNSHNPYFVLDFSHTHSATLRQHHYRCSSSVLNFIVCMLKIPKKSCCSFICTNFFVTCSIHFLFCTILVLALARPTRFSVQQFQLSREFFLTSFLLALGCSHDVTCMKHLRAHPREWARTNQLVLCTRGYSANYHAGVERGPSRCHGASRHTALSNASVAATSQVRASVVVLVY
jgi:hypothetical protein